MTTSVPTRLDTPCSSQIKAVPRQSLDPRASAPRLQERPGRRLGPALLSWVPWKWCQRAPSTPGWTKPSEWGCLPTVKEPSPRNCHLLLSSGVKCHTAPALTCLFPKSPARPWSALLSEAGESQQGRALPARPVGWPHLSRRPATGRPTWGGPRSPPTSARRQEAHTHPRFTRGGFCPDPSFTGARAVLAAWASLSDALKNQV